MDDGSGKRYADHHLDPADDTDTDVEGEQHQLARASTSADRGLAPPKHKASSTDDSRRKSKIHTLDRCESTHKLTSRKTATARSRPPDIGILAIEVYFPNFYVEQEEIERYDRVTKGKYKKLYGQEEICIPSDREDTVSMAMTAVDLLLSKNDVDWNQIGYIQVASESPIDKSKSIYTNLMRLWMAHGIDMPAIEGSDVISSSFGGTQAFFNVLNWLESTAWDGRMGVVVTSDVTIYDRGVSRPTTGAAAVAMLMGAHAPIIVEPGLRASVSAHVYDFYKPMPTTNYPIRFNELTTQWYFRTLDECYGKFCLKCEKRGIFSRQTGRHSAHDFDATVFHCTYSKMAEIAFARIFYTDYLRATDEERKKYYHELDSVEKEPDLQSTYNNQKFLDAIVEATHPAFEKKCEPSLRVTRRIGNTSNASVFVNLVSMLVLTPLEKLLGHRIGCFAHGPGVAASMFAVEISDDEDHVRRMVDGLNDIFDRLGNRIKVSPDYFVASIEKREKNSYLAPFRPQDSIEDLRHGTWYLESVDSMHRRTYKQHGKIKRLPGTMRESFSMQKQTYYKLEDHSSGNPSERDCASASLSARRH